MSLEIWVYHGEEVVFSYGGASGVSRETILIALTTVALNDLEVNSADILNAYVTAPVQEKS